MTTIVKGQFYKEYSADDHQKVIGWTILHVEAGSRGVGSGRTENGKVSVVYIRNDTRTAEPLVRDYHCVEEYVTSARWIATNAPLKRKVELPEQPAARAKGNIKHALRVKERREEIQKIEEARRKIISPIVELDARQYVEAIRTSTVLKVAKRHKISPECVWQYLCLWWQFGCNSVGLRPRHSLSGQKGFQERLTRLEKNPSGYTFIPYKTGRTPSSESDPGIEMGVLEVRKCRKGGDEFLFVPSPDHKLRYNFTSAWIKTKNKYFDRENDPTAPAPTLKQFITAVTSDPQFQEKSVKIVGRLPFLKDHRQRKDRARANILGPGVLGQLDDVLTKVILVHETTKLPLGMGRFFGLSDTWSGAIAGAHDTLEGSTFEEAKQCLRNAFSDKKPFKERHHLTFDLEFVPCSGVFKTVLVDGGPMAGDLSNDLPPDLCNIQIATAYRPDLKSAIETSFHAYVLQVARELQGYNRQKRCRGDDDPKIAAYLTPTEFRRILWDWIAVYNARRLKDWLPPEAMAVEDMPDPSPYALWTWGTRHCGGELRHIPEEELDRLLLACGEGTLTSRRGVTFKGLTYVLESPPEACKGIFEPRPIGVRYDTKYARSIFIVLGEKLHVAHLIPDQDEVLGKLTFKAIEALGKRLRARGRATTRRQGTLRECLLGRIAKSRQGQPRRLTKARKRMANAVSLDRVRQQQQAIEDGRRQEHAERVFVTKPSPGRRQNHKSAGEPKPNKSAQVSALDFLD